ncbi:RTA1 domain-containing protein [Candidatus Bathyarchaeota archaeon]|nr:RTA1 domain-containing protein [Candidatus Bathyarchaeota archaeon]
MSSSFADCTSVTPSCPVEATTYGYYPSLGPNATLLAVFASFLLAQILLGALTRVYAYSTALAAGCLLEAVGYAGRLVMNDNPWDATGMRMQIVCIIIGPSFVAGGIYFTLKHYIRLNGPEYSWLNPDLYTWVFIGCDIGSILLQAAGGGIAASAEDDKDLLDIGNNVIIAGIAFQVATMVVCGILTLDYSFRRYRHRGSAPAGVKTDRVAAVKATLFQGSVALAYFAVLIRCIYR